MKQDHPFCSRPAARRQFENKPRKTSANPSPPAVHLRLAPLNFGRRHNACSPPVIVMLGGHGAFNRPRRHLLLCMTHPTVFLLRLRMRGIADGTPTSLLGPPQAPIVPSRLWTYKYPLPRKPVGPLQLQHTPVVHHTTIPSCFDAFIALSHLTSLHPLHSQWTRSSPSHPLFRSTSRSRTSSSTPSRSARAAATTSPASSHECPAPGQAFEFVRAFQRALIPTRRNWVRR
ncbi:hypothetical protein C8Q79DRAFT_29306 [Trametes meyenii]|nr:hypothetical protein C8Q79DRAFT_29306 [Trametes meyenii]